MPSVEPQLSSDGERCWDVGKFRRPVDVQQDWTDRCVSHPNYPISQPRSGLLHQHWALQQDNYCSQMRSAVEAQAKAILLNSFLQSGPVWRNYHHTTPQCHFYIPLKVISCPPLGSMFFKCDERSLSMLIVRVCVRECQFALAIKVPQTGWIPACSPPTDIRQTLNM